MGSKSHSGGAAEDSQLTIIDVDLLNATPDIVNDDSQWAVELWSDDHDPLEVEGSLRIGASLIWNEGEPREAGSLSRTGGKVAPDGGNVRLRDVEVVVEDSCVMVLEE